MKIDYELAEKIEPKDGEWWMCDRGGVQAVFLRLDDDWRGDDNDTYSFGDATPLYKMVQDKPILPKPQVRVEYERAKYSKISEAISAHESGVKFKRELPDGDFTNYLSWFELCECYANNYKIVVEIENQVDWQYAVVDYIYGNYNPTKHDALSESLVTAISSGIDFKYLTQDGFLEMCRVALRANGELS